MTGVEQIAKERHRQIHEEGWTAYHDDVTHEDGDLVLAAICYASNGITQGENIMGEPLPLVFVDRVWPWDDQWWKPTPNDRIRELVKAGALIAAEIDRIQRMNDGYEDEFDTSRGGCMACGGTGEVEGLPCDCTWQRSDERTQNMLHLVMEPDAVPTLAQIGQWSDEQCRQVDEWAVAVHLYASDNEDVVIPPRPDFLPN